MAALNFDDYIAFSKQHWTPQPNDTFIKYYPCETYELPKYSLSDVDMVQKWAQDFKFDFTINPNQMFVTPKPKKNLDRKAFDRWTRYLNSWSRQAERWSYREGREGKMRWELNLDVLADAIDHLGLEWEVEITPLRRWYGLGAHHGAIGESDFDPNLLKIHEHVHVISMDPGLNPVAASICLWHELTHAMQAERFDSPWAFYETIMDENRSVQLGSLEYFNTWWEKEAFKNMDLHFEIGPLTRATANDE